MPQVCMNSYSYYFFVIFIIISFLVIFWSLYMVYKTHNSYREKFDSYKYLTALPEAKRILNPILQSSIYQYGQNDFCNPKIIGMGLELPARNKPHLPHYRHRRINNIMPMNESIVPTEPPFLEIGYVQNSKGNNLDKMFKLYGRKNPNDKFTYYVMNDINHIKIPIYNKNGWELNSGDEINIEGFKEKYIVKLYY